MDTRQEQALAAQMVDALFADTLVPADFSRKIVRAVGGTDAVVAAIEELWQERNARQQSGGGSRDFDMPIMLTRGYDPATPEVELSKYLAEEKILINREIFRKKLAGIDFAAVQAAQEKSIMDDLNNESIGLSAREVALYYTLIKVGSLGDAVSAPASAQAASPASAAAAGSDAKAATPQRILQLLEENITTVEKLAGINDGKQINREYLMQVVKERITRGKVNPKVLALMLGETTKKFISLEKEFLSMTAEKWGDSTDEVLRYYGLYVLVNGGDATLLRNLQLSVPLSKFVADGLGRIKEIHYVSILFIMTFMYVLLTQVYEVSKKFHASPDEQKVKILKLYNAEERLKMLVNNAVNIASQKISSYRAESRDVTANITKFLAKHKDIINSTDMFKTKYE
ncbi:MAG: hypothetical protein HZC28_16810 [Spirochaetes bacterium]|nr:hypothetical protein [Spirochaetota bacterium]